MAITTISTVVTPSLKAVNGEVGKDAGALRVVVSRTSFTRADGSVVTTTLYSDGTTETVTEKGDTVTLSQTAQKLLGLAA